MKLKLCGALIIFALIELTTAEPIFGAPFNPTTEQFQVSAKAFECAAKASFATERCRVCNYDFNKNSKSNLIKICVGTCDTLFTLFRSNIGYNAQGVYFLFALAVNDASNDGTCLLSDYTMAINSFNSITGYMNTITTYISRYMSSDQATKVNDTWNEIASNMNSMYVKIAESMNLTSSLYASENYQVYGKVQPEKLQALVKEILAFLGTLSNLWTVMDGLLSSLCSTIISGKWCQDLCDNANQVGSVNASITLFEQIEDSINSIVGGYNTYSRDICYSSYISFENVFFNMNPEPSEIRKYYVDKIQPTFKSDFDGYIGQYNEVSSAITDSDYYAKSELNRIAALISTTMAVNSLTTCETIVKEIYSKMEGYSPCKMLKCYENIISKNGADVTLNLCAYTRIYLIWSKLFPLITNAADATSKCLSFIFGTLYKCAFSTSSQINDCFEKEAEPKLKAIKQEHETDTKKTKDEYNAATKDLTTKINECLTGEVKDASGKFDVIGTSVKSCTN